MRKKRKRHRDDSGLELVTEFDKTDKKRRKRRRQKEKSPPRKGDPIPKGNAYKREQFNWRKALEQSDLILREEEKEDDDEEYLE